MTKGRWLAVGVCSVLVAVGTGLLYAVLGGSSVQAVAIAVFALFGIAPLAASWLSGRSAPLAAGAGGLALGIGATVVAAAADQGGTGAMPVTLGVAVAGAIALRGGSNVLWGRVVAVVLVTLYALLSARFIAVAFAYPLLGLADEFTDVVVGRRARASRDEART